MITLIRWVRLTQLRTKWKLALYLYIDKQAKELLKHPEEIEKAITKCMAEIIHDKAVKEREMKNKTV